MFTKNLSEVFERYKKTSGNNSVIKGAERDLRALETRLRDAERALEASLIASANNSRPGAPDNLNGRMEEIGAGEIWYDGSVDLREWADGLAAEYQTKYGVAYGRRPDKN